MVDKLVAEYTENIDESKIAETTENKDKCSSYLMYIVLFSIIFTTSIGIAPYFVYYKYMNHNKENVSRYDYVYQARNYYYKRGILNKLTSKTELIIFTTT